MYSFQTKLSVKIIFHLHRDFIFLSVHGHLIQKCAFPFVLPLIEASTYAKNFQEFFLGNKFGGNYLSGAYLKKSNQNYRHRQILPDIFPQDVQFPNGNTNIPRRLQTPIHYVSSTDSFLLNFSLYPLTKAIHRVWHSRQKILSSSSHFC